jgi:hypothetical protein
MEGKGGREGRKERKDWKGRGMGKGGKAKEEGRTGRKKWEEGRKGMAITCIF